MNRASREFAWGFAIAMLLAAAIAAMYATAPTELWPECQGSEVNARKCVE